MTLHRLQLFTLLGLTAGGYCFAQKGDLCTISQPGRGFAPPLNEDAYAVLDAIGKAVPFYTRSIKLVPSSHALVKKMGGAAATLCGAVERFIFFDPTYVDSIKPAGGKSDLPRYFVLAHEAAHHVSGDTLAGNDWTKDQELAADYSAAVWLTRLGVTKDQLLQTHDALRIDVVSGGDYPTRAERRQRVIKGCEDAARSDSPSPVETNIAGMWKSVEVPGGGMRITQKGNKFEFNGWGTILGMPMTSSGSGTVSGQDVKSTYTIRFSNGASVTGGCEGKILPDRMTMKSICTDPAFGTYPSTGIRE